MRVVGDGALLASLSRATGARHARHRRDHPARAGRGDPLPRRGRDDRDRRPGHRQDRGRAAPGGVPALLRPQPVRRRRRPGGRPVRGVRRLHRAGAAVARRGHGDAALARLAGGRRTRRPGSTRPTVAAIKGSLRMRRVLERAVARRGARRARPSCGCSTGGTLLRLDAPSLDRIRRRALPPRRPAQRGPRRRLRRRASTRCGQQAPRARGPSLPEHGGRSRPRSPSAPSSWSSCGPGGRGCAPMRGAAAGWPSRERLRALRATGCCPARRSTRCRARSTRWPSTGRRSPTWRCWTSWTSCSGRPPQPARRRRRDPFHVRDGVQEVSTFADRQAAARARRRSAPDDYRDYAHVVVDEAQDVSPMQWRMIGRRGPYASWTDRRRPGAEPRGPGTRPSWTGPATGARRTPPAHATR